MTQRLQLIITSICVVFIIPSSYSNAKIPTNS